MPHLSTGSDTFYKYPELWKVVNKKTGNCIIKCTDLESAHSQLKLFCRANTRHLKDYQLIKCDRKEELKWQTHSN